MTALAPTFSGTRAPERLLDDVLFDTPGHEGESDSWLMSYLDLLMLLVTFFVLMLALYAGNPGAPSLFDTRAPQMPRVVAQVMAKPSARLEGFYRPPARLAAAPVASDAGFYAPAARTSSVAAGPETASAAPLAPAPMHIPMPVSSAGPPSAMTAATPAQPRIAVALAYQVPLFELPEALPELPRIDGVQVTAIAHGYNLRIEDHLLFNSSAVGMSDGGERLVQRLLPLIAQFDGAVSVEGHTDSVPIATRQFPSNWELSSARAGAVVRALRQAGVESSRLRAIGYASTEPLATNDTSAGRARNRRVEIVLQDARSPQ